MDAGATNLEGRPAETTGRRSPLAKQCFVTLGVHLNMITYGMVSMFPAVMLPRIIDEGRLLFNMNYWSGVNIGSCIVGNFINLAIMSLCGRRVANWTSIVLQVTGWLIIIFTIDAPSSYSVFGARSIHCMYMGMMLSLSSISIGEYTSPKKRGAFLTTISVAVTTGIMVVKAIGLIISLKQTAVMCTVLALINLLIVWKSPESPSFLADKGRFEESRRVFRWLRGNGEDEELEKMIIRTQEVIEANRPQLPNRKIGRLLKSVNVTIRKRDIFKPIVLMTTVYVMSAWADDHFLIFYAIHLGYSGMDIVLNTQKVISFVLSIFIIKWVKRRLILLAAGGLTVILLLMKALCIYAAIDIQRSFILSFVTHLHAFVISAGVFPMSFVLAGEVFPLRYRSLASAICVLLFYCNEFIRTLFIQFLLSEIGLWRAYLVIAGVVGLCLGVVALLLPETKDRTLQDIENTFRGRSHPPEEIRLDDRSGLPPM